jgi:hypothetical protein
MQMSSTVSFVADNSTNISLHRFPAFSTTWNRFYETIFADIYG